MIRPSWSKSPASRRRRKFCRSCASSRPWRQRYASSCWQRFDANNSMTRAIEVANVNWNGNVTTIVFVLRANLQGNDANHLVIVPSRTMARCATYTVLQMMGADSSMRATGDTVTATGTTMTAMADGTTVTAIPPPEQTLRAAQRRLIRVTPALQRPQYHLGKHQAQHRSPHLIIAHPLRHDLEVDIALVGMNRGRAPGSVRTSVPACHRHRPRAICRVTATVQPHMRHGR